MAEPEREHDDDFDERLFIASLLQTDKLIEELEAFLADGEDQKKKRRPRHEPGE